MLFTLACIVAIFYTKSTLNVYCQKSKWNSVPFKCLKKSINHDSKKWGKNKINK